MAVESIIHVNGGDNVSITKVKSNTMVKFGYTWCSEKALLLTFLSLLETLHRLSGSCGKLCRSMGNTNKTKRQC